MRSLIQSRIQIPRSAWDMGTTSFYDSNTNRENKILSGIVTPIIFHNQEEIKLRKRKVHELSLSCLN